MSRAGIMLLLLSGFVVVSTAAHAAPLPGDKIREAQRAAAALEKQSREQKRLTEHVAILKMALGDPVAEPATRAVRPLSMDERMTSVRIPAVAFEGIGLAECLDRVAAAADVKLTVEWEAIQNAGVKKDAPVTLRLANVTPAVAFAAVLKAVSGPTVRLHHVVEDDAIRVSTAEALAGGTVTRFFDVSRIIDQQKGLTQDEARDDFARKLRQAVSPASWKDNGGSVGEVSFAGNRMSVTQSPVIMPGVVDFVTRMGQFVEPEKAAKQSKAQMAQQGRQIVALRAEVARLSGRCRAAGKPVPPEPVPPDEALARAVPRVTVAKLALADCIDVIGERSGQRIVANWPALEAAGVKRSTPVTFDLVARPLEDVLSELLKQAGGGSVAIDYQTDAATITISTRQDLDRNTVTRLYDVRDLLADAGNTEPEIHRMVQSVIDANEPATWRQRGGTLGLIREEEGYLTVVQCERVHRMIATYLNTRPGRR